MKPSEFLLSVGKQRFDVVSHIGSRPIFHNTMDLDSFSVQVFGSTRHVLVGVFGLCTAATPQLSQPGKEVVFEQPHEHAKRCVKLLKDQGCEFIVALTHLSLVNDKELAEKCEGINVILGGHDHDPFFLVHRGVLIAKCGQNADHLGILDLHMDFTGPNNSLQVDHSFQFLSTSKALPDPKVSEIAQKWNAKGQEGADETICHVIDVELQLAVFSWDLWDLGIEQLALSKQEQEQEQEQQQ
eukprot:s211_g27.t1